MPLLKVAGNIKTQLAEAVLGGALGGAADKKASLAEYSVLFDEIDRGVFGDHVKEALFGVCEGMTSSLQSQHAKTASSPFHTTEEEARQARLDQLLRKF